MARLAIFTERYTIRRAVELTALTNFRMAAAKLGHDCDFLFRSEIMNIPRYDGLLIRALTDPLNSSYGTALVLKAPNSSFSAYVEKVHDENGFVKVGKRFLRRAERLVVQQYLPSS